MKKFVTNRWLINCIALIGCIFATTIILFLCSYSTSPLFPYEYGTDSAIFQTIGKYWTQGIMPYSQLFEHKGPLLFFINAIGYYFAGSKFGIFIIQIINFVIVEIVVYRFFRIVNFNKLYSFLFTIIVILYVLFNLHDGNMCEEYCLSFLFVSVSIQYKWITNPSSDNSINWKKSLFLGITLGVCCMTRLTNALGICVGLAFMLIYMIVKSQFKLLATFIVNIIIGFVFVVLPFSIYFWINGIFFDYLYGTIIYNIGYINTINFVFRPIDLIDAISLFASYGLFVLSIVFLIINRKSNKKMFYIFWSLIGLFCYILMSKSLYYQHYSLILSPYLCVILCIVMDNVFKLKNRVKHLNIFINVAMSLVMCILFVFVWRGVSLHWFYIQTDNQSPSESLINSIPEQDKGSIVAYNCQPNIYLRCDFCPCYKYFIFQSTQIDLNEAIREKIINEYNKCDAKWILIWGDCPDELYDIIINNYSLDKYDSTFSLYHLK